MKKIIKFLKDCPGAYIYPILFLVSLYYNDKVFAGMSVVFFLWCITSHYKDKANKEYIDLLEQDRDKWYQKYVEEKYGKKDDNVFKKKIICKN